MNPNDVDQQDPSLSDNASEIQPRVLSAATIMAAVLMLVFGLSGFMGILGVAISLSRTTHKFFVLQESLNDLDDPASMQSDPSNTSTMDDSQPQAEAIEIPTSIMNPLAVPASPWQIGLGILDFALSIPMVLWSIFVLQHKRSAAVRLAWLALLMAILMIPRAIISYVSLPSVIEGIKTMILKAQEQQSNSILSSDDLEVLFQFYYFGALGCGGFFLLLTLIAYLFCFIQLRKPTTLARLSA